MRPMVEVTMCNSLRDDKFQMRVGIQETLAEKVVKRVLLGFRHVEKMNEGRGAGRERSKQLQLNVSCGGECLNLVQLSGN